MKRTYPIKKADTKTELLSKKNVVFPRFRKPSGA